MELLHETDSYRANMNDAMAVEHFWESEVVWKLGHIKRLYFKILPRMFFHIPYTHGQMDNSDIISSIQWIAMMINLDI